MRQIKSFSLAKQQTEFLKTFCKINELKESEVMQWLIDKLSIDEKMQQYCFNKITAKRSSIQKEMITSYNVQTVKQKDASEPIIRDISATNNISQHEHVTNEELDWLLADIDKKDPDEIKKLWMAFVKADPKKAEKYKTEENKKC